MDINKITSEFDYSKKTAGNFGKFWFEKYSDDQLLYKRFYLHRFSRLKTNLKNANRLLDIGCGFGDTLYLFRNKFNELIGIDPSKEMFDIGNYNLKSRGVNNAKIILGISEKIDFPDNYFDTITLLDVFEHLHPENIPKSLKEINRVIKQSGNLVIITPSKSKIKFWSYFDNLLRKILFDKTTKITTLPKKKHTEFFYNKKEVINLLKENGFTLEKFYRASFYPAPERLGTFHILWQRARKTPVLKSIFTSLFILAEKIPCLRQKMVFIFRPVNS